MSPGGHNCRSALGWIGKALATGGATRRRRQPEGTVVVHSDRGGQFRSRAFRATLKADGLTGSMGRVAAAGANAAMESFYSLR
jgi:transposase InsO family protein